MSNGRFITAAEAPKETVLDGGCHLAWYSGPHFTKAKDIAVVEAVFEPNAFHAFHKHPGQEELIYVLNGEIEQWLEDKKQTLKAGDAIFIAPGVVHATYNRSKAPAKIMAILGPCKAEKGIGTIDVFTEAPWNDLHKK